MTRGNIYEEDNSQIVNYMDYNSTKYMKHAVPFNLDPKFKFNLDANLSPPTSRVGVNSFFKINNYRKVSVNTYHLSTSQFDKLLDTVKIHYYRISNDIYKTPELHRVFHQSRGQNTYLLKIVDLPSYRFAYTALKEMIMKDRVYKSVWRDYRGSNIVSKPMLCSPVWTGKKWQFIMVSEYAIGHTLHQHLGFFHKIFNHYDKHNIMNGLEKTIETLWVLGFSHNDLTDVNVIYDKQTGHISIIDFESCIQLPDEIVNSFRRKIISLSNNKSSSVEDLIDTYKKIYKEPALSLLYLAENICCRFAGDDRIIYNTDDFFLEHAKDVL
jgi:hypothetical protein